MEQESNIVVIPFVSNRDRIHFGNLLFSVLHYFRCFIQGFCKSLSQIFSFRRNALENIFWLHYLTKRKCMTLCKQWNNTSFAITQSKYPAIGKFGTWDVREFFKTNSEASCLVIQIGNYFLLNFIQEERYVFCRCDWHVQNSKCNGYSSILRQSFYGLKIKEKHQVGSSMERKEVFLRTPLEFGVFIVFW